MYKTSVILVVLNKKITHTTPKFVRKRIETVHLQVISLIQTIEIKI